ncbi:hypothetical protein DFH07DRAFT_823762 [Mycena maculata]|uniref:Fork-head domain-containing protein n=1 Tax=Mycena maculata TaxID=230809 RepID=A0AAD7J126_9AGAR|nr:hypothetical protein DFH07DRAFT_823762 [Mycena maculata]
MYPYPSWGHDSKPSTSNLSLPRILRTATRRRLTGPHYLQNILNSDSEPEVESSSSKTTEQVSDPECPNLLLQNGEDTADYLRRQLCLSPSVPVDLWAIADPPDGEKPFASLPTLVKLAIYGSPQKRLTLQGICDALIERFSWFEEHRRDEAWKNSVRHNLSLNKVFRKLPRDVTHLGKGCYWVLDVSGGEGHKRPRKRRRRSEKLANSDHDELDSVGSSVGTPKTVVRPLTTPEVPPRVSDSLTLLQPYPPCHTVADKYCMMTWE